MTTATARSSAKSTKAPRSLANLLPGAPTDLDFYKDIPRPDADADPEWKLTPAQRRLHSLKLGAVAIAMGELVDALGAAFDADDETDPRWSTDIGAMLYLCTTFQSLMESGLLGPLCKFVDAEREQRRQAFAAGKVHCGCPVLWAQRAFDAAAESLGRHGPQLLHDERLDARYVRWAIEAFKDLTWEGFHKHMNKAAQRADIDEMMGRPVHQKVLKKLQRKQASTTATAVAC